MPIYLADGFAAFQSEYEAANLLLGKRIRFLDGSSRMEGRVVSIGSNGMLYIQTADAPAPPRGFLSGEVSSVQLADGAVVEGCASE